jgi:hypothetical protein
MATRKSNKKQPVPGHSPKVLPQQTKLQQSEEIAGYYAILTDELQAASAIVDAAASMIALERSAQKCANRQVSDGGRKMSDSALPDMLRHAVALINSADNEADCMREQALLAIAGGDHV